jgi:hypothetical protein
MGLTCIHEALLPRASLSLDGLVGKAGRVVLEIDEITKIVVIDAQHEID